MNITYLTKMLLKKSGIKERMYVLSICMLNMSGVGRRIRKW